MKFGKKFLGILMLITGGGLYVSGQTVAIKTNLLSDAFANVNLGVEVGLADKWSLEIVGDYNGWNVNDHRWRHWLVQPEARYWFCKKFAGNFIGVNAIGGNFNFGNISNHISFLGTDFSPLSDHRYQGWGAGLGFAYGYDFILGKHWNLELTIGIGYIYSKFDEYECVDCGRKTASGLQHNYFGPTKAGVNIEYIF